MDIGFHTGYQLQSCSECVPVNGLQIFDNKVRFTKYGMHIYCCIYCYFMAIFMAISKEW